MIFVDANIPMYLAGEASEHKDRAKTITAELILARERLVTDVEVLQEILHRYSSIDRRHAIQPAYDALLNLVDAVLDIRLADLELAKTYVLAPGGMIARDALHRAVMANHGISRILSFDRHFRDLPDLVCLPDDWTSSAAQTISEEENGPLGLG